eukprot:scaffold125335_cov29-Prasinocladus_malaysianus.AAC.1
MSAFVVGCKPSGSRAAQQRPGGVPQAVKGGATQRGRVGEGGRHPAGDGPPHARRWQPRVGGSTGIQVSPRLPQPPAGQSLTSVSYDVTCACYLARLNDGILT